MVAAMTVAVTTTVAPIIRATTATTVTSVPAVPTVPAATTAPHRVTADVPNDRHGTNEVTPKPAGGRNDPVAMTATDNPMVADALNGHDTTAATSRAAPADLNGPGTSDQKVVSVPNAAIAQHVATATDPIGTTAASVANARPDPAVGLRVLVAARPATARPTSPPAPVAGPTAKRAARTCKATTNGRRSGCFVRGATTSLPYRRRSQ